LKSLKKLKLDFDFSLIESIKDIDNGVKHLANLIVLEIHLE